MECIGGPERIVYRLIIPTLTARLASYLPGCLDPRLAQRGLLITVVVLKGSNPNRPAIALASWKHIVDFHLYRCVTLPGSMERIQFITAG